MLKGGGGSYSPKFPKEGLEWDEEHFAIKSKTYLNLLSGLIG